MKIEILEARSKNQVLVNNTNRSVKQTEVRFVSILSKKKCPHVQHKGELGRQKYVCKVSTTQYMAHQISKNEVRESKPLNEINN